MKPSERIEEITDDLLIEYKIKSMNRYPGIETLKECRARAVVVYLDEQYEQFHNTLKP